MKIVILGSSEAIVEELKTLLEKTLKQINFRDTCDYFIGTANSHSGLISANVIIVWGQEIANKENLASLLETFADGHFLCFTPLGKIPDFSHDNVSVYSFGDKTNESSCFDQDAYYSGIFKDFFEKLKTR